VRPSPTAGQASLEYIAVISLVAALLLLAAPAVGAPSIADTVARGIRIGLCVVDDGICTREDAMAAGLPPCQLDLATRGYDARVTAFSIELGSRDTLTGFRSSDGSFSLMWSASGSLGVAIGADLPFVPVSRDGAARAKLTAARGWTFPDEATLRRFIAGMPKSAANQARWPAAWHTVDGSVQAEAELKTKAGNLDLEKLGFASEDMLGARITRDGTVTVYASMNFEGPEKTWAAMPSTGPGKESAVIEVTLNGASPRSVALRVTAPSEQNSRLTETVYRVPLNGLLPPPPRKIPDQARFFGTIERNVYSYSDSTRGISGEVAAGIKLGVDAKIVDIRRTLIDATAQTPGSDKERSRFDCLDQLR
jgi:hypothetical protein